MNTDIIVTPADTSLSEGNGTSRSIYLAAGEEELPRACRKIGHCDVGLAAATPAFHLHCKYILHAVSPFYEDGKHGETELLRKTYENTLSLAETSLSIAEIADRTGFGGASYFSEVFRRYYHCSGREYREQVKKTAAQAPAAAGI